MDIEEVTELGMDELREMGRHLGILSLARFEKKEDLIRTIQLATGQKDCFGFFFDCDDIHCSWRQDCASAGKGSGK